MSLIVMKFGGTSVGNLDKINNVANIVENEVKNNKLIVVLSAMAGVTNQLDKYAREASSLISNESLAEYDSIISSGEQVTSGLVAIALNINLISSTFVSYYNIYLAITFYNYKNQPNYYYSYSLFHFSKSNINLMPHHNIYLN